MRYPTATVSQCRDYARAKRQGDPYDLEAHWVGKGEEVDLARIEDAACKIRALCVPGDWSKQDEMEGRAAEALYASLVPEERSGHAAVEVAVLDDPAFWRYLSLKWFWDFIEWRQWKEPKRFKEHKHLRYLDGRSSQECVLTRMFLRMATLGGSKYGSLAACLPSAADFWRSHIFRVRTAGAPNVVRAMVEAQREVHLKTNDVREFAKRVNRTWSNVLLDLYSQEDAAELLIELRSGLDDRPDAGPK